jgi:hypothetical protein
MNLGDYVSLGAEMAQLSKLRQLQEHLLSISALQEAEVTNQNYLLELKNVVFKVSKSVNDLIPVFRQNPKFALLFIKQQLSIFSTYNITPEIFREFSDKEYVQKVLDNLNGLLARIHRILSAEDIKQVEEALRAINQMPFLEQAIEMAVAKDKIIELIPLSKAWAKSKEKVKMGDDIMKWGAIAYILIGFFPILFLAFDNFLWAVLFFGFLFFMVYVLETFVFKDTFKEKHPNFEQTWISLNQIAQTDNSEIWRQIQSAFGTVHTDRLKKMRDERQALITSIVPESGINTS